jgi:hypothetical protein
VLGGEKHHGPTGPAYTGVGKGFGERLLDGFFCRRFGGLSYSGVDHGWSIEELRNDGQETNSRKMG